MMWAFTLFLSLFTQAVLGGHEWVGTSEPEEVRSKHDTWKQFLAVDTKHPFPCTGNVAKVKFFSGSNSDRSWSNDRQLTVGVFRQSGSVDCSLEVVGVKGLGVIPNEHEEYQSVVDFEVEAGDFFGFYSGNYGVVSFDWAPETVDHKPDVAARTISDHRNHCGDDVASPVEGSTVELVYAPIDAKDSWSYRDYAIWFYICCDGCITGELGTDNTMPLPWPKHDTARKFLQVDMRYPFPCTGHVTDIRLFTGSDSDRPWSNDRGLKFGVYRPATPEDCGDFEVIALEGLGQFPDRNVHAKVPDLDIAVVKGDNWGFYWSNYGVVSFDWTYRNISNSAQNNNYCGAEVNPNLPVTNVNLAWGNVNSKDSTGHRDYAIWVKYHCC